MARKNEFSQDTKSQAFERADGSCENCGLNLLLPEARFHHIRPIQDGGSADLSNCQVLCEYCHSGSDFNFRELHPNAPPRIMFDQDLDYKERARIAKRQQRKYDDDKRGTKKRKSWNRPRENPFE